MRFFTIHERPGSGGDVIAVGSGFAWLAFFVPLLWLLWHRLWLGLAGYILFSILLGVALELGGIAEPAAMLIGLAVSFLVGAMAADYRRWTLGRRGWRPVAVVMATGAAEAEERYIREQGRRPATLPASPSPLPPSPAAPGGGAFPRLV